MTQVSSGEVTCGLAGRQAAWLLCEALCGALSAAVRESLLLLFLFFVLYHYHFYFGKRVVCIDGVFLLTFTDFDLSS